VFNETLGLIGRKQQEGRVESFDVAILEPNAGLYGYVQVKGSAEQITALRADEEFRRSTLDAQMIVDNLRHIEGFTNEGVATAVALYQDAIEKVPQRA
jgi:hypothetical protein